VSVIYCCGWSFPAQFRGTQDRILLSQFLILPQPGGPGTHIYIPQEQGGPDIPPGTGFPFRRLLRLEGLRWRYSNPPPHGTFKQLNLLLIIISRHGSLENISRNSTFTVALSGSFCAALSLLSPYQAQLFTGWSSISSFLNDVIE
jgi:hypothetical protein